MNLKRKWINVTGNILVGLSIIFIIMKLIRYVNEMPVLNLNHWALITFITAVMFSATNVIIAAYIWGLIIRGGGVFINLRQSFQIIGQAQIAKYIPGNIFQYIGRGILGHQQGIPTKVIALSISVETILVVITATFISLFGFLLDKENLVWGMGKGAINEKVLFICLIFLLIFIVTSISFLFPHLKTWVRPILVYLHPYRAGVVMLLQLGTFIIFGIVISSLVRTFWGLYINVRWYQFTWGFALAWVLGFIVPGAPGGIGVREVVFTKLFDGTLGEGVAVCLAVVLRVITILGDLLAFGVAYWLGRKEEAKSAVK